MVNWSDQAEILRDNRVSAAFSLALAGVATWEVVVTFAFDLRIITRKKKWRWIMVLYFLCRICMLLQVWSLAILSNAIAELDCNSLSWIVKISEAIGMCASSMILALRAFSVWGRDIRVGGVLLCLSIGQIGIWCFLDRYWITSWNSAVLLCIAASVPAKRSIYIANTAYTMGFDLIILCLMLRKLFRHSQTDGFRALLLKDGIYYFLSSVLVNGFSIIFEALNLNIVMFNIAMPFALVISIIAATRLFRHTSEFTSLSSEKPTLGVVSAIAFRSGRSTNGNISQTFALADMQGMYGHGAQGAEVSGNNLDVERFAESEHEKSIPRSIHHVLGEFDFDEMDSPKPPPL